MRFISWLFLSLLAVLILLCPACGSNIVITPPPSQPALSADNVNLIFVVSEDLAYQAPGDINPVTANLTNQGLNRSLLMGQFLQKQVLGMNNVTGIYALEPMTIPDGEQLPDMVALETVQQFAVLNQISLPTGGDGLTQFAANSYRSTPRTDSGSYPPATSLHRCYLLRLPGSRFQ